MQLSVIIPVYNAEKFLTRAIESVLIQEEVSEIVLVEDASFDNSIEICNKYIEKHPELIKLYKHDDEGNHGAAATRNLGIQKAQSKYIAFLDADDFYLPNRFSETIRLLENDASIDGVYGSIGVHYEENISEEQKNEDSFQEISSAKKGTAPEELFETIAVNHFGWIHLNTLTIRKNLIEKSGYFENSLKQGQDAHFIWKLAAVGSLKQVSPDEPIAMRGVHPNNRVYNKRESGYYHKMLVPLLLDWGKDNNTIIKYKNDLITNKHLFYLRLYSLAQSKPLARVIYVARLILNEHSIIPFSVQFREILKTIMFFDMFKFILRNPFFVFKPKHYQKFVNVFWL